MEGSPFLVGIALSQWSCIPYLDEADKLVSFLLHLQGSVL
jgi:hypothetical protein